jgi:hypothetical protein
MAPKPQVRESIRLIEKFLFATSCFAAQFFEISTKVQQAQ